MLGVFLLLGTARQVQLTDDYLEFQPPEGTADARNGQALVGVSHVWY